jgi:transposase-like protein
MGGKKKPGKPGRGASGKIPVVGAVERGGRITVMVTDNVGQKTLTPFAQNRVSATATIFTDEWSGYGKLSLNGFTHRTINHKTGLYVDGDIHTQNIEAFWSLLKRSIKGTYVSVEPFHLSRYLDEYSFRFNTRRSNDGQRFLELVSAISGKRLTYAKLTGQEGIPA